MIRIKLSPEAAMKSVRTQEPSSLVLFVTASIVAIVVAIIVG